MLGGVLASLAIYFVPFGPAGVWRVVLTAVAFVIAFVVCGDLASQSSHVFSLKVVEQVLRYPGHERWIAVPSAMLADEDLKRVLWARCKTQGLGLLTVERGGRVTPIEEPSGSSGDSDLLGEYRAADEIRAALASAAKGSRR